VIEKLVRWSRRYPSLLRGACEAYASGAELSEQALSVHPAVARRAAEFWSDQPTPDMVRMSGLAGHPWLTLQRPAAIEAENEPLLPAAPRENQPARGPESAAHQLTAKEHRLLQYLQAHAGEVCEKDELVQAVWPEDVIYQEGIRDESLAQLVRRLRVKIEPDPAEPRHVQTVPGRGYLFKP
jgi:hypothetical protein